MARIELTEGYSVPRVLTGCWQLAAGHRASPQPEKDVVDSLVERVAQGFDTFDCADIYTGVEELLGRVRRAVLERLGAGTRFQVHTKLVPDRDQLGTLRREDVERIVDRSLRRLDVERLDLVQFYWWDDAVPGMVDAMGWLDEQRRAGKVRLLGVTNFDCRRLEELLTAGLPIATQQLQYSLLDRRPDRGMAELCEQHGIALLSYGSLAGGFLSDRYIGQPDPGFSQGQSLENRSLVKYRLIIEENGGWQVLQRLLAVLTKVAGRHRVGVAEVAARWVLERPGVAAVILGASRRRHDPGKLLDFELTDADRREIGNALEEVACPDGDVYELERDRSGPHSAIMKYNLNRESG